MTNSIIKFIYTKLDTNEYNFHIWRANIKDLIRGTVCDPAVQSVPNVFMKEMPLFRPEFQSHNYGNGWGWVPTIPPTQYSAYQDPYFHNQRNGRQQNKQP